ncbi:hypothetical protein EV644_12388 [Kribbella orskensis]|uniref:Uncharacterized protein n=1 Tax=Kribbella orskensis TaxID=2512216 RepID=A0ABY2BAG7_9ACTN|nr:hypothetical protein EV642_12535 [Kribbella sp. VKM Ac-2500]TCO13256.1 hypothetical protein EV644_12388 [Kribbella orskensis]
MGSGVHRLATAYRLSWSALSCLVGVLGFVAGLFLVPAGVMFPLLFVAAVIGLTVATTTWSQPAGTTISAGVGRFAVIVVAMMSAIVACAGLIVLFGGAAPGLVVVLGVTSPAAMSWCGRRLGHIPGRLGGSGAVTTAELCRQWQDSYQTLRDATTAAARLRIVETRQLYLDELERRDPIGLRVWLGENASAAGNPSRFLARDGEDASPADG